MLSLDMNKHPESILRKNVMNTELFVKNVENTNH